MTNPVPLCPQCGAPLIHSSCPRCNYARRKEHALPTIFTGITGDPAPVVGIRSLGTATDAADSITISSIAIDQGEAIIAFVYTRWEEIHQTSTVTWNGLPLALASEAIFTVGLSETTVQIWYRANNAAATGSLVIDGGNTPSQTAEEFNVLIVAASGLAASPLDVAANATGTSTLATATTATTAQATELVVAAVNDYHFDAAVGTWGSGMTAGQTEKAFFGDFRFSEARKTVSAAGPQTASYTLPNSAGWAIAVASFKAQ